MTKNTLTILFIVLAVAVVVLFFIKKKKVPPIIDTTGGAASAGTMAAIVASIKQNKAGADAEAGGSAFPLTLGSRGDYVKAVQRKLGITPDGIFGNKTLMALRTIWGVNEVSQNEYYKRITV